MLAKIHFTYISFQLSKSVKHSKTKFRTSPQRKFGKIGVYQGTVKIAIVFA